MPPGVDREVEVMQQAVAQKFRTAPVKILIVEDHQDSREAFRALFEAFGYDVVEAANGREAIQQAGTERPAIILMDIMMPEVDGFDASRSIRLIAGLEHTPIIALTAMDGAKELALQAGMSDYVRKPVDIHGLLAKVSGWLKPTAA
jgi:CheY-like chemotaxis protein